DWLRRHPGVEIIARDRCGLYAEGAQQGASSAVQVTDRYHLMSNLSEAVEHTLQQLQIEARAQLTQEMNPEALPKIDSRRSAVSTLPPGTVRALHGGGRAQKAGSHSTRN